jgi:hypothetical protein
MRTVAMVKLLTDMYTLDIGVDPATLENIRNYRDRLMRYRALQSRQSGTLIAKLLLQTQNDSSQSKKLETAVTDAIRHLGYDVEPLGTAGEPEGIARAFGAPVSTSPTPQTRRQAALYLYLRCKILEARGRGNREH